MGAVGFVGDRSYWVGSCTCGNADGVPDIILCMMNHPGKWPRRIQYPMFLVMPWRDIPDL